jgi:hypothetical protein
MASPLLTWYEGSRILAQAASSQDKDEVGWGFLRLDSLPAVPPYWRRMRAQNMSGVAALRQPAEPPALASGYRSSVAASLLTHHDHAGVVNVIGGMTAWTNAGYPIE